MTERRIVTVIGLERHPILRPKYECDRCGARFTTCTHHVDNTTPYQPVMHSAPGFPHLCDACHEETNGSVQTQDSSPDDGR